MAVKQNYKNVLKYLEENNIDPKKALEIIIKADPYNPNNIQARWKMKRFQLYLWARLDEHENGWLLKKQKRCETLFIVKNLENLPICLIHNFTGKLIIFG